ncbi:transposase [Brachybacterium saurashtrense]|uniref:Transposase n=1 Tax=Brachybacterium saurashtrense TaxID=556288 RepID=A0A345YS60_9MICO|nr:transposase [Brachybacterium saurashtrense]RRR22477.1 transposase [Brachybacterium saurashtrense]
MLSGPLWVPCLLEVDTLSPTRRKRDDLVIGRKTYSAEFRRDVVESYRPTPTTTVMGIAAELGITDTKLSN